MASSSSSSDHNQSITQKKKTRGPTTCKKMKKKAQEAKTIEFDDHNRPIGPNVKYFSSYIGSVVRIQVDINISDWHKVDRGLKNTIWEDIKREFSIEDEDMKKPILRVAGSRWKDFKTRLVRDFINKEHPKYTSPTQLYDFLTEEQWQKFKKERETKIFKEKSQKAKERQLQNEHPHFLGKAGYVGMRSEWLQTDPLSSASSCGSISSSILSQDRSLDWVRARSKKKDDGTYYIPNEKTRGVYEKIIEKGEEATQGTFVPNRQHDFLAEALGKEEHPGRVRGYGVYVTIRDVYGKPDSSSRRSSDFVSKDAVQDMIVKENERVRSEWQNKFDSMQQKYDSILRHIGLNLDVDVDRTPPPPPPTRSSCHSIDPNPYDGLQKPIPCRLAVTCDDELHIVARGTVFPSGPETVVHHLPLLTDHLKVTVDDVVRGAKAYPLPVPSQFHTTVGEAIGSFNQWPQHLVMLGEEESPKNAKKVGKQKKAKSSEMSSTRRSPLVDDATLQRLGDDCKMLHNAVVRTPAGIDFFTVPLDENVFHHTDDTNIYVTIDDIADLLRMEWLNISILQIHTMYLHELCEELGVSSVGFMCPSQIASIRVKNNFDAVITYMAETMMSLQSKQYVLAPYFQENHWMLLVIHSQSNTVYFLDSARSNKRKMVIRPALNTALKTFWINGGKRSTGNVNWKSIACPQQPGGSECGYYVMRNMYEIVTQNFQLTSLDKAFYQESYSMEEMDDIIKLWVKYFYENCM